MAAALAQRRANWRANVQKARGIPENRGFQKSNNRVVPGAGIEPARLAAGDFESPASTNFTTPAKSKRANYRMCCGEFDYLKRARAF